MSFLAGRICVNMIATKSSAGSTKKCVLKIPLQEYSPLLPGLPVFSGPLEIVNPNPKPYPLHQLNLSPVCLVPK